MAEDRHRDAETTIRTRIQQGQRRDPIFGLPNRVQGPVLALLMVHPLAWAACWGRLLRLDPGEQLPLLSLTVDSLMQGSLLFAVALLAQCLLLVPPVWLTLSAAFWSWTLLALAGARGLLALRIPLPPLP